MTSMMCVWCCRFFFIPLQNTGIPLTLRRSADSQRASSLQQQNTTEMCILVSRKDKDEQLSSCYTLQRDSAGSQPL